MNGEKTLPAGMRVSAVAIEEDVVTILEGNTATETAIARLWNLANRESEEQCGGNTETALAHGNYIAARDGLLNRLVLLALADSNNSKDLLSFASWALLSKLIVRNPGACTALLQIPSLGEACKRTMKYGALPAVNRMINALCCLANYGGYEACEQLSKAGIRDVLLNILESRDGYLRLEQVNLFSKAIRRPSVLDAALALMYVSCVVPSPAEVQMGGISHARKPATVEYERCLAVLRSSDTAEKFSDWTLSEEFGSEFRAALTCVLANLRGHHEQSWLAGNEAALAAIVSAFRLGMRGIKFKSGHTWRVDNIIVAIMNVSVSDSCKAVLARLGLVHDLNDLLRASLGDTGLEVKMHSATKVIVHVLRTLSQLAFDPTAREQMMQLGIAEAAATTARTYRRDETKVGHRASLKGYSDDEELEIVELADELGWTLAQATASKSASGHVMISYCWSQQPLVLEIREELKRRGINVWIDVDDMKGSILAAMAEAVEHAALVLVCISEQYKRSANCRLEAEYVVKMKKPFIPLMMQEEYQPDGWLGILLGSKLWHACWDQAKLNASIGAVCREVELTINHPTLPAPCMPPSKLGHTPAASGNLGIDPAVQEWLCSISLTHLIGKFEEQAITNLELVGHLTAEDIASIAHRIGDQLRLRVAVAALKL